MALSDPAAPPPPPSRARAALAALAVWAAAAAVVTAFDDRLGLANQALVLVLAAALASLWLPPLPALAACALAVLGFNIAFVPPRGRLGVDLHQHVLLLGTMLGVSWIVILLVARQRRLALAARLSAQRAEQLQTFGQALREGDHPAEQLARLQQALEPSGGGPVSVWLLAGDALSGAADADERAGLRLCALQQQAMGPGTGRHEELPAWYLPLRGRQGSAGAALLRRAPPQPDDPAARQQAQALCDLMGAALERAAALQAAAQAREAAQSQALRNTLLAAIAHDHRTPLATILGAASSLHDQADRLSPDQQRRLAASIVDEATQLSRLTENTLQLARLDNPGLALPLDWESAEEIVGTVMRQLRRRDPGHRVRARVEADLPLLRCDARLLVQALDNLVDNALKHGPPEAPVELVARRIAGQVVLAVRDRGPGVPPAERELIFEPFRRGQAHAGAAGPPRGAGVGLALCRAIARAHGGELKLRARGHGGSAFELWMPVPPLPPGPPAPTLDERRPA